MRFLSLFVSVICSMLFLNCAYTQTAMVSVYARNSTNLNGKWESIVDYAGAGTWREVWKEKKPQKKTDFFEYSFEGGPLLNVPGDFNTQMPELSYWEGTVWYKKTFQYTRQQGKRLFLHFGAANYSTDVYLNGNLIGTHEGGFTPFQFELTQSVKNGENTIVVKVNNQRKSNGIPGNGFDWLNYGGITRDVSLIETNDSYIKEYNIQLKKHSINEILGWVKIDGTTSPQTVTVSIPELKLECKSKTNSLGLAPVAFKSKFTLWTPENPKLYQVIVKCESDSVTDEIGFRNIEVRNSRIYLNGKPIFLKGVNIHEENPLRGARAFTEGDALQLLSWAKELGCNMVRLAHYPHNETMVRTAEKMGLMVWSEIPVYQHIEFSDPSLEQKWETMMNEMISRDRNRCNVIIWSLSNETFTFTKNRDNAHLHIIKKCKEMDSTRLITVVTCSQGYDKNEVNVWDTIYRNVDIIAVNEYLGWYVPWQGKPTETRWKLVCPDKPVIISEFGGEALYGNNTGPKDEANSWSEEYQEQIYKDQTAMFANVPNLCGLCPWLLVDYRSPGRMHPVYQSGWNRKGLISDRGDKKKAWWIMKNYYNHLNK
jgi:beta-glucuronidase